MLSSSKILTRAVVVIGGVGICNNIQSSSPVCEDSSSLNQTFRNFSSVHYASSFPANNPSEDRLFINKELKKYQIFGVFDGHGGWQVSDFVIKNLPSVLFPKLTVDSTKSVSVALHETFHELESNYIEKIKNSYNLGFGEVAKVGCCANISILHDGILTVANSGDCRTIIGSSLGQSLENVSYESNPVISNVQGQLYTCYHVGRDHNARTPLEKYLLSHDHPNEENIVRCKSEHACYVKGRLQLTRAIGDLYLKLQEFNEPSALTSR